MPRQIFGRTCLLFFILLLICIAVIISLLAWFNAPPKRPDSIPLGDYSYAQEYTAHRIEKLMKQHHLPSAAVALIEDQDVIFEKSFGLSDIEKEISATPTTVYKVWSVSKAFTAIETMRLVEEGLLDLDAPLSDYLPDFSIQTRFAESTPITSRSLLAHRSGLPRNGCYAVPEQPANPQILEMKATSLTDCYLAFPTGSRYKYSNIGPDILGYLIQTLRGEAFASRMKSDLFEPLGMLNSAFLTTDLPVDQPIALGYEYYKGDYYPRIQGDITSLPSGNLYTTLEDLSRFVRFILGGGEADGQQLIQAETLQAMFTNQYPSPDDQQPMGLGWKLSKVLGGELLVWHDGGPAEGTGALVAMLPESKLGVVLIANATSFESSLALPVAVDLLEVMLETKTGSIQAMSPPPPEIELSPELLEAYTGTYILFGQAVEVSLHGKKLEIIIQGIPLDVLPISESKFRLDSWLLRLGIDRLLPLPMDLRALEIEFLVGEDGGDRLVVNFGGIVYETYPRYPVVEKIPEFWEKLAGSYDLYVKIPTGEIWHELIGHDEIVIQDGMLIMPGVIGPILPINNTTLIIQSGPFAGECILYDPQTGYLTHQYVVYKPAK